MDNKKRRRPSSSDQKKLDGKPIGDATSGVRHKSGENGRGHNEEGRKTPSVEGGKGGEGPSTPPTGDNPPADDPPSYVRIST